MTPLTASSSVLISTILLPSIVYFKRDRRRKSVDGGEVEEKWRKGGGKGAEVEEK